MSARIGLLHVVFKTHLDVGFTNLAGTVVRQYMEAFIPQAIAVARRLRERGGEERFLWTTGSWLIYEYLERADAAGRADMERAIADGDIRWHALPFTTHTEAMTPALFLAGLGLSRELDRRFGVRTIAAKMTDVPGHTRAMVPLLAEAGVEFLHIGVNPASPAPEVPDLFRWRDPGSGTEVAVLYHKSGYGSDLTLEGLDEGIVFAHTGDNNGPQSPEQIVEQFARLRERFPGARIRASTMDAFAAALRTVRESLPVVEQELGDTWIHGLGTDPGKVAAFRSLCRKLDGWQAGGSGPAAEAFARRLLLVPEHTWGLDFKTHLGDYVNYARPDFEAARARDVAEAPVPEALGFTRKFLAADRRYSRMEASWREQRDYLDRACEALADPALAAEARAALAELRPAVPALDGVEWLAGPDPVLETAHFRAGFDSRTGALVRLIARATGVDWAAGGGLGLLRYQTFSATDCERYLAAYNVNMEHAWCHTWAIPDFGKPGLRPEQAASGMHEARLRRLGVRRGAEGVRVVAELGFDGSLHRGAGAPGRAWMEYEFPDDRPEIRLRVQWFDKPANRMPEALWCSFRPGVRKPEGWRLHKLGRWVSPLEVAPGGNRAMHGVQQGVRYEGPEGTLRIESPDAALVAPGRPKLLEFDREQPDLAGGMHFNLYNNVWGTNFPLWYGEDGVFRFVLATGGGAPAPGGSGRRP